MANLDIIYDIDHRTEAFEKHDRGVLICLAGPGTGKTYSLLARSAALDARGVDQDSICYLTFIREISKAFIDDYIQRFGEEAYATTAPRISTLHSFACRVIRNQGFRVSYDGELYFMNCADDDPAAETLLQDFLRIVSGKDCHTVPQLRSVVEEVKGAWQNGVDPATRPGTSAAIAPQLAEFCRCFRLIDWDQTIPLAGRLLSELDEAPEWLSRIKHYFVDEYQDFNKAEQALILQLSANADSMVIVGDDDQSLYSKRGGSPDGIRGLYAAPEHEQVTLAKCYRCKENIVRPTNRFQAHLSATPRPMTAHAGSGQVECYSFKSSKAEVAFLVEYLKARLSELPETPKPKDGVVCLFPSKAILSAYFEMMAPHLPCARRSQVSPDNRMWLEHVLTLLIRGRQRFLERLLLNSYAAVKPRHRVQIVHRVLERDTYPALACKSLVAEGAFTGLTLAAARAFVEFCDGLAERDLGIVSHIVAAELSLTERAVFAELERLLDADEADRLDFARVLCDTLLPASATKEPDQRAVMFLTMHGSKGLSRKTVVLPGLEEACLPDGGDPAGLPEKQRLFFVALSRATDNLLLTLPYYRGGTDSLNFPMAGRGEASSFIAAAGLAVRYHP